MIKKQLEKDLREIVEDLGYKVTDIVIYIPQNPQFGDYATNIALQLAKQKSEKPEQSAQEIANKIVEKLLSLKSARDNFSEIKIAGPGFINFFIKDEVLLKNMLDPVNPPLKEKTEKIFIEYAQPNTHKAFHIGHFRNISLGESIARLLEFQGNQVFRATYGSDIGLPVAKALWGVMQLNEEYNQIKTASSREKAEFLGKAYALGATKYESSDTAKKQINEVNKQIYQKNSEVLFLWEETRQWSIDYFETIFFRLSTRFDRMFWESEVSGLGQELVKKNINKIFLESEKAIIYPGEKHGLHNRVFITADGHPTYEAKELGLAHLEYEIFPYDLSLHVVANEQDDYFKVVFKVIESLYPKLIRRKKHVSYAMVNLSTGKMSSRTGDVITAESLLDDIKKKVAEVMKHSRLKTNSEVVEKVAIGAAKFAMLKFSPQSEIGFDVEKSVSLEGDSGPYVQYAYARTQSVLSKAQSIKNYSTSIKPDELERKLLINLEYFNMFIEEALISLHPNNIALYVLNLAKDFNLFYQKERIIGSEKELFRLNLTAAVGQVLKKGLELLGIEAPERM